MSEPVASYKFFDVLAGSGLSLHGKVVYEVANRGTLIGFIEWHPRWLRWVLAPEPDTVWSDGCLADVQTFIRVHAGKQEQADV